MAATVELQEFDISSVTGAKKPSMSSDSEVEVAEAKLATKKTKAKAETAKRKAAIVKLQMEAATTDLEMQNEIEEAEVEVEEASVKELKVVKSSVARSQRSRSERRANSPAPTVDYEDMDDAFESLMAECDVEPARSLVGAAAAKPAGERAGSSIGPPLPSTVEVAHRIPGVHGGGGRG